LIALVAAFSAVPTADAHALLVRSDPPQGARLPDPPREVTTWFSEPLEPGVSSLRVLDGSGRPVDMGSVYFDPADSTKMSVALRDEVGPGFYSVIWETLSRIDGHFRFGSFAFLVLNPDGSEPTGPRPTSLPSGSGSPGSEAESALTKFAGLAGAVMLIGSLAFALVVARPASRQLPGEWGANARRAARRHLAWFAVPSIVLLVAVGGVELLLQAGQIGGMAEIRTVLGTSWGERWLQRQIVLAVLATAFALHLWLRGRKVFSSTIALWSTLFAGLGYLLLVSLVSHAGAVLKGSFWAVASDFTHLLAAAIWTGSLAQLALILIWCRRLMPDGVRSLFLADSLRRFSLLAGSSAVILLGTGTFNAFVEVPAPEALIETAYGRVLTAKLALLLPLLLAAGVNAFVLRPRLVREATQTGAGVEGLLRRVSRIVALEVALAIAVLAIVGLLVQYTPSRTEAEVAAGVLPDRDRFALPLAAGSWAAVASAGGIAGGLLAWLWAAHLPVIGRLSSVSWRWLGASISAFGLLALSLLIAVGAGGGFNADVALRFQTPSGRFVLLEISPFEVGENQFRVTVLSSLEQSVAIDQLTLRLSRLEREGLGGEAVAVRAGVELYLQTKYRLDDTGWWQVEVLLPQGERASFYLRLDQPSGAPLQVAPPDYDSDPAAEALYRRAVANYEGLTSVKWREGLTSGLLAPTGIGAWVITAAEVEAPDRLHYRVLSPGFSDYQVYRVGETACSQSLGEAWQCSTTGEGADALYLDYLKPTAFRLGRTERVDGEMTQLLLFYNPSQPAWYAWWVSEESGLIRRQAMVAPGHFMQTQFFEHNKPIGIEIPGEALASGG
jgi:putative copper export protein/methionine-rich copper-binding protein CopC